MGGGLRSPPPALRELGSGAQLDSTFFFFKFVALSWFKI